MHCTDIVDVFYNNISHKYKKYIGQTIDNVIKDLSVNHIVIPYTIKALQNDDIVIWKSTQDSCAHVTAYKDNKFYCMYKDGIKIHPVLIVYKRILIPKHIVRLKE